MYTTTYVRQDPKKTYNLSQQVNKLQNFEIFSAVWIQYTNVTDGQTDERTPGDSKDRAYA